MVHHAEHFQVRPLDLPLLTETDLLGASLDVSVGGEPQRLLLPLSPADTKDEGPLVPPDGCGHLNVDSILIDGFWGEVRKQGKGRQAEVHGYALVLPLDPATIPDGFDPKAGHWLGGDGLKAVSAARRTWNADLVRWVEALTSQSMHLHNPGLQTLSRPSENPLEWATADGDAARQQTSMHQTVSIWSDDQVESERLLDLEALRFAAGQCDAGSTVPLSMELRANAHIASRRGERRLAVTEIGTACEAWLTALMGLDPDHGKTLGGLVTAASLQGIPIPADATSGLVKVRNDAVHRGVTPPRAELRRALEIADEIWALADPALSGLVSAMRGTSRAQRQDLVIFIDPKEPDAEEEEP